MNRPLCRKCLLSETDPNGAYLRVKEMIEVLPEEIRTDSELYGKRLAVCGKCECLTNGICEKCGCFAEYRAAKKNSRCPHEKHFW